MEYTREYADEMLAFAKTLKGRALSKVEQQIKNEQIKNGDKFHYFMVFGIQPETQQYIDYTIKLLEECSDYGHEATANCRLDFSVEDLKVSYPADSTMEKHRLGFIEWKKNNPN